MSNTTHPPIDLNLFDDRLVTLRNECLARGIPKMVIDRIEAVRTVLPNIERARQAQDKTNG